MTSEKSHMHQDDPHASRLDYQLDTYDISKRSNRIKHASTTKEFLGEDRTR